MTVARQVYPDLSKPNYPQVSGVSQQNPVMANSSYPDLSQPNFIPPQTGGGNQQKEPFHVTPEMSPYYTPYGPGKLTAEMAASLIPGMELGGPILNALGRIGTNTAAMSAVNALLPDKDQNLIKSTEGNLALNALLESIPPTARMMGMAAGKMLGPIMPQQFARQIMSGLSKGADSLGDNAKNLAQMIKTGYNKAVNTGKKLYDDVFHSDALGDSGSLREIAPGNNHYLDIDPEIVSQYTPDLRDWHNKFNKNPSLDNAQNFQSDLSSEIRSMEKRDTKGLLSQTDRGTLQNYRRSRDALQNSIHTELQSIDPVLSSKYAYANDYWGTNVAHYADNAKLSVLAKKNINKLGGKELSNISDIFKDPNEDMLKIANDLGPDFSDKIVYDRIGKLGNNPAPEKLIAEIDKLKNAGFSHFVSPTLEQNIASLGRKSNRLNLFQHGLGALTGAKFGSALGIPGEAIGAAIGSLASPAMMHGVQSLIPGQSMSGPVANALAQLWKPTSRIGGNELLNTPNRSSQ